MPLEKINKTFTEHLKRLSRENRSKGPEKILSGIVPPDKTKGTRYHISGEGKKEFLRMNSNSYLGLGLNKDVIRAEEEAVHLYGCGPGAVRFISGTSEVHRNLEKALAQFHQRKDCLLLIQHTAPSWEHSRHWCRKIP